MARAKEGVLPSMRTYRRACERAKQAMSEALAAGANGNQNGANKAPVWIAIYTRKSNDENLVNNVTSLDSQKSVCRSYIGIQKEKGWQEYPEAFDDPAESGKDLKRPAMQRLLKAIHERRVQAIVVYKLDRLTRNSKDFHHLLEVFEKHNVAFVSATESLDTKSPQGRLMTAILVQFAAYDRELDVERSKDFHLTRARKGLWCAGLPPLGYDIKDKLLIINEKEAETVRKIFDLYLSAKSTVRVAEKLNRMGYRRKTYKMLNGKLYGGKLFDKDSIIRIIRRKIYIGFVTNERTGQDFPGQHKPIAPPADFEKANKLLDSHDRWEKGPVVYSSNRHGFRLKGLIRCGECRSTVVGYARPKKGKVYRYYKCLAHQNGQPVDCAFKSAGADKVEEFVIEKLATVGWDRPFLEKVVRKVEQQSKAGVGPLEKERRGIGERLQGACKEIQKLINLTKAGAESDQVVAEIRQLEAVKKELEARLFEIEASVSHRKRAVYDVDAIQGALQRFARFIYRIPLPMQIQVIRLLVKQVALWKNRVDVELHELPVNDLQKALDGNGSGGKGGAVKAGRSLRRRDQNTTAKPDHPQTSERTAVAELEQNWRGRREQKTTDLIDPPVPSDDKTHYMPPSDLSWPVKLAHITNGEKVIEEAAAPSEGDARAPGDVPTPSKFQSSRSIERRDQKTTDDLRPDGAASRDDGQA